MFSHYLYFLESSKYDCIWETNRENWKR